MITVFVGKPGKGKTYTLTRLAYKFLKQGKDVYTNFPMDFEHLLDDSCGHVYYWQDIFDIVPIKKGEIFMDELQIYINSRRWKDMPPDVEYKFQQHRKHDCNIWGSVQNIKRLDTTAREVTQDIFELKRIGRLFMQSEFSIDDLDKDKRDCLSRSWYFLDKKIASCYNHKNEIQRIFASKSEEDAFKARYQAVLDRYAEQAKQFPVRKPKHIWTKKEIFFFVPKKIFRCLKFIFLKLKSYASQIKRNKIINVRADADHQRISRRRVRAGLFGPQKISNPVQPDLRQREHQAN